MGLRAAAKMLTASDVRLLGFLSPLMTAFCLCFESRYIPIFDLVTQFLPHGSSDLRRSGISNIATIAG